MKRVLCLAGLCAGLVALVWFVPAETKGQAAPDVVTLPAPRTEGPMSLEETLKLRRSVRSFTSQLLTTEEVSQLAWAAQGVTRPMTGFRTAPSAGATYPLECYFVLPEGIYKYQPQGHVMIPVREGDQREALSQAASGQDSVRQAACVIVITAVYSRTTSKYGERAKMYVHIEAGHVGQNVLLQAVALNLGGVPVGAFRPAQVAQVIGAGREEEPIYILPIGHPAQ